MTPMLLTVLLFALTLGLAAWGLPLATAVARTWTYLYTRVVPTEVRARRIEEIKSALFEQVEDDRGAGYKPSEIGLRILLRVVSGAFDDLTWASGRVAFLPSWRRKEKIYLVTMVIGASVLALEIVVLGGMLSPIKETVEIFGTVVRTGIIFTVIGAVMSLFLAYVMVYSAWYVTRVRRRVARAAAAASVQELFNDIHRIGVSQALFEPSIVARMEAASEDKHLPEDARASLAKMLARTRVY